MDRILWRVMEEEERKQAAWEQNCFAVLFHYLHFHFQKNYMYFNLSFHHPTILPWHKRENGCNCVITIGTHTLIWRENLLLINKINCGKIFSVKGAHWCNRGTREKMKTKCLDRWWHQKTKTLLLWQWNGDWLCGLTQCLFKVLHPNELQFSPSGVLTLSRKSLSYSLPEKRKLTLTCEWHADFVLWVY